MNNITLASYTNCVGSTSKLMTYMEGSNEATFPITGTYQSSCEPATSDPPSVVNPPGTVAPGTEDSSELQLTDISRTSCRV